METIIIDPNFSTTRIVFPEQPKIKNSPYAKFQSRLLLPFNSERKGEGGLRTKGYFKCSYNINNTITELETSQKLNSTTNNLPLSLVTIITVVFNSERYLEQTIQSVIDQTYDNVEYIIIDGGSTDGTLNIIKKYEQVIDYWLSEPDQGIYDAMNKGIKLATGQIIGLLNSGDLYTSNCIQEVVHLYNKNQFHPKLIISGAMYRFDQKHDIKFKLVKKQEDVEKINQKMSLNHPATFVSKKVYETVGLFDNNYKICGDYDFLLRAYSDKEVDFIVTHSILTHMMLGGISEQFNNLLTRCYEQFSLRRGKINFIKNVFYTTSWLIKTLTKQVLKKYFGNNSLLSYYYKLRHGETT